MALLRHPLTDQYLHPALSPEVGADYAGHLLCSAHEMAAREWLAVPAAEQEADLRQYLQASRGNYTQPLNAWQCTLLRDRFLPPTATVDERRLYLERLNTLLLLLSSDPPNSPGPQPAQADWRVDTILRQMEKRFGEPSLTLATFSRELDISEHYLGGLFKRQVGSTFHQHLRAVRMRRAAALLEIPSIMLKQIAGTVGYTDPSNFTRDFRECFRTTPKAYRHRFAIESK